MVRAVLKVGGQMIGAIVVIVGLVLDGIGTAEVSAGGGETIAWQWLALAGFVLFLAASGWTQIGQYRALDQRSRFRAALGGINDFIARGNVILEECGRPRKDYYEAPMHFLEVCIPKMNGYFADLGSHVSQELPEYMGKLTYVGNVTHGTDEKAAMVQSLEGTLTALQSIADDLRDRALR